jgi:hypothetical protein
MASRIFTALSVVLGFTGISFCQQPACKSVEVPVSVINASADVLRGLAAEDFIGRVQKKPVTVKTLTYDDGPRRVLLVVDASKKFSEDTRKAVGEMVRTILASARPEDTFALLPAHGHGPQVKFTSDRSALTLALGWDGSANSGKDPGVLDSVMDGIQWFETPQAGDAIVVIAADLEGNHKANAKLVAKTLEERHIRMFGLAVGPVMTTNSVLSGTTTSAASQGLAWTTPLVGTVLYTNGDENFFPLTTNSGGLVLAVMNSDSRRTYRLADPRVMQEVRQKARSVSKMVSAYYRMQVEPPQMTHPEDWSLDINEEMKSHFPPMVVLYPRELGPC